MIRINGRFNPAQLYKSADSRAEQFSVDQPISEFKRLLRLVEDYRLSSSDDGDGNKSASKPAQSEVNEASAASESEQHSGQQLRANFRLAKFADSSFFFDDKLADNGSEAAKPAKPAKKTDASGLSNAARGVQGGSDERAAGTPIIVATGELSAEIDLQCQRCLATYRHRLETPFKFAFAANEATADLLPDNMDPVMLDEDGTLDPASMFEDELLLRLPTHARHADISECNPEGVPYSKHLVTEEEMKPESPFSKLKGLNLSKE